MTVVTDIKAELETIQQAFQEVLQHRQYILGPEVEQLERLLSGWLQTRYAIGCNSGFGAHLLSLIALDIDAGSRVIVPAFSPSDHTGTIVRRNATPVLVDVAPESFHINPSALAAALDGTINAIVVHHLFGSVADMNTISQAAKTIPIVEVLTYSFGARIDDRYAGTFGTLATSCLREETSLGAYGDAGMIWTNDAELVEKIRRIRAENSWVEIYQGITSGNFHMDTVHAAILIHKFQEWQTASKNRTRQATLFAEAIRERGLNEIIVPDFYSHFTTRFVVLAERREALVTDLQAHGIAATSWWPVPIHLQPGFRKLGYARGDFPQAEQIAAKSLYLPLPPSAAEIDAIVDQLVKFYRG